MLTMFQAGSRVNLDRQRERERERERSLHSGDFGHLGACGKSLARDRWACGPAGAQELRSSVSLFVASNIRMMQ